MSFTLFDQLTGPLSNVNSGKRGVFKGVKYGVKTNVHLGLTGEYTTQHERRGALFTNIVSPFGVLHCNIVDEVSNNAGLNVRFLNDLGRVDETCISDFLSKQSYFRKNVISDLAPMMASYCYESHVAVLVNLLRVAVILRSDPKEFEVKPQDLFYDDGHVNISYENFLKRDFPEWNGLQFEGFVPIEKFDENKVLSDKTYCPNLENLNGREYNIFTTLLGAIECNYPLRIAFNTPRLVEKLTLPPRTKHGTGAEPVYEMSALEVETVLRKYIFANRVQSDFDLAYHIVTTAMFAPLPRCAEAHGWITPIGKVTLPATCSIRGVIPQLTQGSAYEPYPEKLLTWAGYANNQSRMLVHAVAACEAYYTGLFEILTASPGGVEESLDALGVSSLSSSTPYRIFCEAVSYRFGKPFELFWDTQAGVDCYSHLLATEPCQIDVKVNVIDNKADGYEVYELFHGGQRTQHLICRELKPALYPILSMGVNDDRFFNNQLEFSSTLVHDETAGTLNTVNSDDANKAMSIFRLGGYNATLVDSTTNRAMRNWTANSNGQVVPVLPPGIVGKSVYKFPTANITARKYNWMQLPTVTDRLTMNAKINIIGYGLYLNGAEESMWLPKYTPVKVYPKALVAENMVALPMKTDPTRLKYRYQGFTLAVSQDKAPVVHLPSSPSDTSDSRPDEDPRHPAGAPADH